MTKPTFTWLETSQLPGAASADRPSQAADLAQLFERAREGEITERERKLPGFVDYAVTQFDDPDIELSTEQRSFLLDDVAPHATTGMAFIEWILEQPPEDFWTDGVAQALGAYGQHPPTREAALAAMQGYLERKLVARPVKDDWLKNMLWRDLIKVAVDLLPPQVCLEIALKASRRLGNTTTTYQDLQESIIPRLRIADDPVAAVDDIVAGAMAAKDWQIPMGLLLKLVEIPAAVPAVREQVLAAVGKDKKLRRRLGVLVALRRCGVEAGDLQLTAKQAEKYAAAHERAADVISWLVEAGMVAKPQSDEALAQALDIDHQIDVALEPRVVLTVLHAAKVAAGFDAETGVWPVPYDELMRDDLCPIGPPGLVAWFEHSGSHRSTTYRLTVALGETACRVEFVDDSDYYDVDLVLQLLNRVLERSGTARRYTSLLTGDQCAEIICQEPDKTEALLSRWVSLDTGD